MAVKPGTSGTLIRPSQEYQPLLKDKHKQRRATAASVLWAHRGDARQTRACRAEGLHTHAGVTGAGATCVFLRPDMSWCSLQPLIAKLASWSCLQTACTSRGKHVTHHVILSETQQGRAICWHHHTSVTHNATGCAGAAMSLAGRPEDVAARMSKIPWYRYPENTAQLLLEQLTRLRNDLVDNGLHGCPLT